MEEEQQLHLQLEEELVKSKDKLNQLQDQYLQETVAYSEVKELQDAVNAIAKELDTEEVSEEKHDAKAASPSKDIPSSSLKGKKPISEMVAGLENIDENVQEDEDH